MSKTKQLLDFKTIFMMSKVVIGLDKSTQEIII